jgi:hypothetical protein
LRANYEIGVLKISHPALKERAAGSGSIFFGLALKKPAFGMSTIAPRRINCWLALKGLSHEIDLKNFDKNLQNLT